MVADGLQGDHGVGDGGDDGGNGEGVLEGHRLALLQGALDDLAAVGLHAGHGHIDAVQLAGDLQLDLRRILVRREGRLEVHRLRLVQRAQLAGAAVHLDLGDLVVAWKGRKFF